ELAKGIDYPFATNAIHFIAYNRVHRARAPFNNNSKTNLLLYVEFLPHTGKSFFDIKSTISVRGPKLLERGSSFFNDLLHDLEHMVQRGLRRQVLGQTINRDVELH